MERIHVTVQEEEKVHKYFLFETPFYEVKWPKPQVEKFAKHIQKLVENRGEWPSALYQAILKKLKYVHVEEVPLDTGKLQTEETVIAIADEFIKKMKINTVPQQKSISEALVEVSVPKKAKK